MRFTFWQASWKDKVHRKETQDVCLGCRRKSWARGRIEVSPVVKEPEEQEWWKEQIPGLRKVLCGCLCGADQRSFKERWVKKGLRCWGDPGLIQAGLGQGARGWGDRHAPSLGGFSAERVVNGNSSVAVFRKSSGRGDCPRIEYSALQSASLILSLILHVSLLFQDQPQIEPFPESLPSTLDLQRIYPVLKSLQNLYKNFGLVV